MRVKFVTASGARSVSLQWKVWIWICAGFFSNSAQRRVDQWGRNFFDLRFECDSHPSRAKVKGVFAFPNLNRSKFRRFQGGPMRLPRQAALPIFIVCAMAAAFVVIEPSSAQKKPPEKTAPEKTPSPPVENKELLTVQPAPRRFRQTVRNRNPKFNCRKAKSTTRNRSLPTPT